SRTWMFARQGHRDVLVPGPGKGHRPAAAPPYGASGDHALPQGPGGMGQPRRRGYMVWVGLSAPSIPASIDSILVLAVSASAESLNCTPIPAVRLPCAPGGVIQMTLP